MIVYQETKAGFLEDAFKRDIEVVVRASFLARTGRSVGASEVRSWKESLVCMARVLNDDDIPDSAGVGIEYNIPQTGKRIDVILTGRADNRSNAVIVELKQWEAAKRTNKDAVVVTQFAGRECETSHPSYQAWSYAALLRGFNEAVYSGDVELWPCAYLHNYAATAGALFHDFYKPYLDKAPLFAGGEAERDRLRDFIKRYVRHGDGGDLLFRIEESRIRPSQFLVDSLDRMLRGQPAFVLIDDQKVVFENVLAEARAASSQDKRVVIVEGGPGTGKSVVAINLLVALSKLGLLCMYVSKNAAPRAVYESRLTGTMRRTEISNLFSGSGKFTSATPNCFDVLVVDEAHRLNEKSGLYGNLGDNQIKELISASKCAVFFADDRQQVTVRDIGTTDAIVGWATSLGVPFRRMALTSQFRCGGSEDYLAWLDKLLGDGAQGPNTFDPDSFDFRVVSSPVELHRLIREKNGASNKARVVAGYCWPWVSRRNSDAYDIEFAEFGYRKRWNLQSDGGLWIIAPESVEDVGCIHTCQGLEVDYIGVIVGPDMVARDGKLTTQPRARARSDKSLTGLRKLQRTDPISATQLADRLIKNTYRTLLTRGLKGCYVYFTDAETAQHFRSRIGSRPDDAKASSGSFRFERAAGKDLRVVDTPSKSGRYKRYVPLLDLRAAAGDFGSPRAVLADDVRWVDLEGARRLREGMFVSQVVGRSMEPAIPDGSWCLFAPITGTRQGKTVLVRLRDARDPDSGERFTVKRYHSEKIRDGDSWIHDAIVLKPINPNFAPIVCSAADELDVVAEVVEVLGRPP